MNIEVTAHEYRDLLDILHISDVIMSGHRSTEDGRSERHRALIQKLYALATGEGLGNLMSHDKRAGKYVPTAEFENSSLAHVVIDEFGDHLFWDQLISRLSVRDAAQSAGGLDRLSSMINSERQAVEAPIRHRYIEEFSKNGVSNLEVVERFGAGPMPVKTSD